MKLTKTVTRVEMEDAIYNPPWYMGKAHTDFDRDTITYTVIPFNVIVAFINYLLIQIRFRLPINLQEAEKHNYYQLGYKRGFENGCIKGAADASAHWTDRVKNGLPKKMS